MPSHYMHLLLSLVLFNLAACGGTGSNPLEEKIRASAQSEAEHARAVAELPDSTGRALSPLDTLFAEYQMPAFRSLPIDTAVAHRWVDSVLASLTLEEKIGQLFIVDLPRRKITDVISDRAVAAVEDLHVGGFLVPRLMEPQEVFDRTRTLQDHARVPLFFAADYERGVGRFNNPLTELPSNMAIGATRDTIFAAAAGRLTAIESRATGINLLFAPVVDVNNNPSNPIINIRSYGEDPRRVGKMAAAFVHEAQSHGVLATLKHFPGHGNTSVDTHAKMGVVRGDMNELSRVELRPYEIVLHEPDPPAAVMSAHLWIEALNEEPTPATFSRSALTDLLRHRLDFKGFVITDDIKMGALSNEYSRDQRILRPLLAGADVILTPADLGAAEEVVKDAIHDGLLRETDIDDSVRRILWGKARAGLHVSRYSDQATLDYLMQRSRGAYLAQTIANRAVTLLKSNDALPLNADQTVALVQLSNYRDSESIAAAMDYFAESLGETPVQARYDTEPSNQDIERLLNRVEGSDVVVLALYLRLQSGRGEAGLYPAQTRLVRQLLQQGKPVVLVTCGNPYAVTTFSGADAFLVAYDQTLETVHAAAEILRGTRNPQGKLPITVAPFPFGSGLSHL